MTYNPQGHDVYVMAQVLAGLFNDRWKDIVKKLEEEKLKIKVEEETLAAAPLHYDTTTTSGQNHSSLHDLHEHLKRVESQIQSLAKKSSSSKPAPPAVRPASSSAAQAKLRPSDIEKRPMTFEEKRKLSINLETLPGDKLERIVQIIKKRNPDVGQNEDEIEVDIDSFDNDTLWELDRFITNCMKSRGKKKATKKASKQAQDGFSGAPQVHVIPHISFFYFGVYYDQWQNSVLIL
jgi:acetylornithine deacetylase/succinyl-diaminopimelate desuccinylase-like protein